MQCKSREVHFSEATSSPLARCPFWVEVAHIRNSSRRHPEFVMWPFSIIENRVQRIDLLRTWVKPCIQMFLLDWNDAAIVSCGGDFL